MKGGKAMTNQQKDYYQETAEVMAWILELDKETEQIDYEKLREIALAERPKMIVAGASAYAREIDFKRIGEIAKEIDTYKAEYFLIIDGIKINFCPLLYTAVDTFKLRYFSNR